MAIYQSVYLTPEAVGIDMDDDQDFTCQVQGSQITDYQLIIKDLSNVTKYDSTKTALSPVLYNGDTLTITVTGGSVTTKSQLKYTITTWSGASSATTREVTFWNATTPTATLSISSPVATKSLTMTTFYTQAESVTVESYQYFIYDSNQTEITSLRSDVIYSQKLQHTIDGLIDGNSYYAKCTITNSYQQQIDTGLVEFTVDYTQPNINIIPTVEVNENLSSIELSISNVVQNIGDSTGTVSYVEDFLVLGNAGLQINTSSTAYWDVDIPIVFTTTFDFVADGFTTGAIIKFEDDSANYLEIGYDSTGGNFYLDINGDVFDGVSLVLNSNPYVIGIRNQEVIIQQSNVILDHIKPWWIS